VKRTIAGIALLLGVVLFVLAHRANARTDDQAAVRALEAWRVKMVNARDVDGVMALYAPDVFAFDFIPPRQKVGAKNYRANYTGFFSSPVTFEVTDLSITTAGDVAYGHQIQHATATFDGKPIEVTVRCSDVYRKTNGKWLIAQEHIWVPVDLDTGKADLMSKP